MKARPVSQRPCVTLKEYKCSSRGEKTWDKSTVSDVVNFLKTSEIDGYEENERSL